MWKPIDEVSKMLNVSVRTLWRRVGSTEFQTKMMKVDGKGNSKLHIWIEMVQDEQLPKTSENQSNTPNNIDNIQIHTTKEVNKNIDTIPIMDEQTGLEIAQDLQQGFQINLPSEVSQTNISSTDTDWEKARQEDRDRAFAKLEIVKSFMKYRTEMKAKGINYKESGPNYIKRLKRGDFCKNALCVLRVSKIELPTLLKWCDTVKASGDMDSPLSLLEAYRLCGRPSKIDMYLRNKIRELSADGRNFDPSWIYRYLVEQYDMQDEEFPLSKRSIQVMVKNFRKDVNTMALGSGKKALKNNVKLHNIRFNDLLPGELWESDGHKCNILVKSPFYAYYKVNKRYLVRPVVIFWWDVATGTIVGYRVCLNENKDATRNSLMDAIMLYGLPKGIRLDNGGAYENVEYSPMVYFRRIKGKKRLTTNEKIAKRMIESGNMGLYGNLGIETHFAIPGNPESKTIEAFWDYAFSPFEKSFPSWIGNKIENRPEIFQGQENKVLARKYGDKFPTWDEFCEKVDLFVRYYNNEPRQSLTTIDGEKLSPMEVYNQVEHTVPNKMELLNKMKYPYIEMRVVQRSMIEKNGILYWHPIFASMIGKRIGIYYDEKNLREITICNEKGQMFDEKAISIDPGLQSGDSLKAMIENHKRAKIGQLCYLSLCNVPDSQKIEKMLKQVSTELLPLSNVKEKEGEVKYLSFEEALDSIAGEEEVNVEDSVDSPRSLTQGLGVVTKSTVSKNDTQINQSEEEKEIMNSLKDDIAGMFG